MKEDKNMSLNQAYLEQLSQHNDHSVEALRAYAVANQVPIVHRLTLEMIKQLIRIHQPKRILEIGTAIGYSAMQFASIDKEIAVFTMERDDAMIAEAKKNISAYHFENQVHLFEGDALHLCDEVTPHGPFDMIFIDAAKAQSQKFFEMYTPYLKEGGLVITDNVLYHDFVADISTVRRRNLRQMVQKIQQYNAWLMAHPDYTTNYLNIDDGLAISIKGESK